MRFEFIWLKTLLNLRSEVQRNYLSYAWWVLEPLLHMAVYYLVFALFLARGGENYPVFLLTGLVPWLWFMKAVGGSTASIISNQNVIRQVSLPAIIFPIISMLQATLKQVPVFVLLLLFVWWQGYAPSVTWLALATVLLVQFMLIVVAACGVASLVPFSRDVAHLVPIALTFTMFLSGCFTATR